MPIRLKNLMVHLMFFRLNPSILGQNQFLVFIIIIQYFVFLRIMIVVLKAQEASKLVNSKPVAVMV